MYRHHQKNTKEPNNRVLLGALLFGCIVSFVVSNLRLGTYRRNGTLYMLDDDDGDKLYFSVRSSSWPCKAY